MIDDAVGRRTIVLVGEMPSPDSTEPLLGRCGRRIAGLMGVSFEAYAASRAIVRVNLNEKSRLSRVVEHDEAVRVAQTLIAVWRRTRPFDGHARLVLLGRTVESYFVPPTPWFHARVGAFVDICTITSPHPSGRCRAWNDPKTLSRGRDFFTRLYAWSMGLDANGDF